MYKDLIKNYIPTITPNQIKEYGKKLGININDSEVTILYQFMMKNYSEILEGDESSFKTLQNKINPTLYNQLLTLYQENKKKYL